jgi:hypothetical protein
MAGVLIALQRLRSETGSVILPGCPIPGSEGWSETVRKRRIKQGFAAEPEKPKKKRATKKAVSKES